MNVLDASFFQDEENICRSMHNLSTVSDRQSTFPVVPYTSTAESPDAQPTSCVCSTKRHSPLSRSLLQEPAPKRATFHPPSPPIAAATEAEDPDLFGYKKLPLPPYNLSAPPPPLRRTSSEPIYSPGTANSAAPTPQLPGFPTSPPPIKTQLRQETGGRNIAQESYPLPETLPHLYRTVSDPNPASNWQLMAAAAAGTPPRPPATRNASRSPSHGESPSARRLRRMKERLKQMSQWANQVSSADDGDDTIESGNRGIDNDHKEEDHLPQEAVFVEKSGECLVLHFKCPCGDGYQILLSGNSCYYKLTNFRT